jgi:hypothetical protein
LNAITAALDLTLFCRFGLPRSEDLAAVEDAGTEESNIQPHIRETVMHRLGEEKASHMVGDELGRPIPKQVSEGTVLHHNLACTAAVG